MTPNASIPITTASAAPALTPSRPGSASGLRVWPWISAPARPSAAPTSTPSRVRGIRSDRTTMSSSVPVGATSACQTWSSGSALAPTATPATQATTSSAPSPSSPSSRRWRTSATALVTTIDVSCDR